MDSNYFKELLNDRALKATTPRLNLLMTMQDYKSAMPYSAIQKAMDPIDRVTLYRTIESLTSKGIIHKAFQESNEVHYAICGSKCSSQDHQHDHIHFKCIKCNTVSCEKPISNLEISLPDYEIHKMSIHLEGVCSVCK